MNELLEILVDWNFWYKDRESGILRDRYRQDIEKLLSTNQIVSLTGPRRSGKSTLLLQFAKFLISNKNVNPKDILIINFEDYRFTDLTLTTLHKIYETY